MAKNAFPHFRCWDVVPEDERYGGVWVAHHIAEMRQQHPDQRAWQDEERCAQWMREADETVAQRLHKPDRCVAAVLWTFTANVWAPCSRRQSAGDTLCKTHRRMAGGAWATSPM